MKVSSIIKTPVGIDGCLIYELMDWQTRTGKPTKINRWSAPVQGPDNIARAKVIAHTINSHDALVDMVRRLRDELKRHWDDCECGLDNNGTLCEADELLEKEK